MDNSNQSSCNLPSTPAATAAVAAPPPETPEALRERIAKTFGAEVQLADLPADCSCGPFFDAVRKLRHFDDPAFAVQCGPATGLAVIIIPIMSGRLIDAMFDHNLWLAKTMATDWQGLMFFWFRLAGDRPQNRIVSEACWLFTDALIPVHDVSGKHYQPADFPMHDAAIETVQFESIDWAPIPGVHEVFTLEAAEQECGKLFTVGERGRTSLNQKTAVAVVKKLFGLKYYPKADQFTVTFRAQKNQYLETSLLAEILREYLAEAAAAQGVKLPAGELVAELIEKLKQLDRIPADTGLARFVNECLVPAVGSDVVMTELLEAYAAFIRNTGAAAYPERKFYHKVTVAIAERFGVAKAHDISRPRADGTTTSKYGFRGLEIKRSEAPEVPEAPEACCN